MTGPDTVLISISLLVERPKIFSCTIHVSSLLQSLCLMKMLRGGWNKGPEPNKQQPRNSRGLRKKRVPMDSPLSHTYTLATERPLPLFCYKKSKNRKWPPEPKVLTLNQIPLGLNWQAGPGFRLRYHILEGGWHVPPGSLCVKSWRFYPCCLLSQDLMSCREWNHITHRGLG